MEGFDLNTELEKTTGGVVKTVDDIYNLQKEAAEAKAQLESAYPNEFTKKIAEFYKSGVDNGRIKSWVDLHFIGDDIEPEQAIAMQLRMKYPSLTEQDVKFDLQDKFPVPKRDDFDTEVDYESAVERRKSKIKMASMEAMEFLKSQRASMEAPKADPQAELRRAQQAAAWGQLAQNIMAQPTELSFSMEDEKIGGKYEFKYTPQVDEATKAAVTQNLVQQAVQAGLEVNEASLKQLMGTRDLILRNLYHEDMLQHVVRDLYAELGRFYAQKNVSRQPIGRGTANPVAPAKGMPKPKNGMV